MPTPPLCRFGRSCLLVTTALLASACTDSGAIDVPPKPAQPEVEIQPSPLEIPSQDLSAPDEASLVDLRLGPPTLYPPCHQRLEGPQGPTRTLPPDPQGLLAQAAFFYGCGMEASLELKGGGRLLAYPLEPATPKGAPPLRVVMYDKGGRVEWHQRLDRSDHDENFVSRLKGSFLADVPPYLVCAGSMWPSDIQTQCMRKAGGEVVWSGALPFWSGIPPQGANKTLYVADVSGVRRIYPWEGVEMSKERYGELGGRAAFYQTDGETLYFAPQRGDKPILTRLDFTTMKPQWRTQLDSPFEPFWGEISPRHNLVFGLQKEHMIAIDTRTGLPVWKAKVGSSQPDLAVAKDALFLMVRRDELPNLLWKLTPKTGQPLWAAPLPPGILDLGAKEDHVLLKSVQAVSTLEGIAPTPPAPTTP